MEISEDERRLFGIFTDLQKDRIKDGKNINLIDKNRKLVSTDNTINFQGDHLKKQIKFNPEYFHNHLSKCNDNVIRFILLHEEAHLQKGKNHLFLLWIPIIIVGLVGIFISYSSIGVQIIFQGTNYILPNLFLGAVFFLLMLTIVISVSWRLLWDSMYREEINSDLYGAECIVDFFQENDPANIAGEFLMVDPTEKEEQLIRLLILVMKVLGTYPDYHPSDYTRIEKIREKFPVKS